MEQEQPANKRITIKDGTDSKKSKRIGKPATRLNPLWLIIILVLVVVAGLAGYYYNRYQDSQKQVKKLSSNSQKAAQDESQALISKIGKLTVLPKDETPTVATVTDIAKLKDQPFFDSAVNGDRVLIYTQNKKAFLYRPSTNKIINIAPVNIGSQTSGTSSTVNKNQ